MYQKMQRVWRPVHEGEPKTFTQEELEAKIAEVTKGLHDADSVSKIVEERLGRERKQQQAKNEELAKKLEEMSERAGTSEEQKQQLEAQIEQLRSEGQGEKVSLERKLAQAEKKHAQVIQEMTAERDHWQQRFSNQMIQTSIRAAATEHGALPQAHNQLVAIMGSMNARVTPIKGDDGNETGDYTPVVTFNDFDADGKPVVVESMSVSDAVKRMKELPDQFGNLFKSTAAGGTGGNTSGGGSSGQPDPAKMTTAEYMAARKEGKLDHAPK